MSREMSRDEIDELLDGQFVIRLGCRDGEEVYVVPIAYAWDRDADAIVAFSYEGRKLSAMRSDPRVCLELDAVEHFGSWRSVVAWGEFEELEGIDRVGARELLAERFAPHLKDETSRSRLARAMADDPPPVVFRIRLGQVTGRSEGQLRGPTREFFSR